MKHISIVSLVVLSLRPATEAFLHPNPKLHIPNRSLYAAKRQQRFRASTNKLTSHDDQYNEEEASVPRRTLFKKIALLSTQIASWSSLNKNFVQSAQARGLVKFPCKEYQFLNTYHFLRAGESLLEEEGVLLTNPLFLTNREAALTAKGMEQIDDTCQFLKKEEVAPTVIRYSLAAAAMDTTDIVGKELKIGRNNLVPEFNFMDPRAIGKWDMLPLESTQSAVWAMDQKEAGSDGQRGRPPPNEDSTPNETLSDQVVRLQQLISVLETQYSGETILLVFPDGTGPALLTCLIGGIPLNRVHEFEYKNGEVRLNINYDTAHQYLSSTPSEEYWDIIQTGEKELVKLRTNPNSILNVREQQYLEEQKIEEENKKKLEDENKKKLEETERIKKEQRRLQKQKIEEENKSIDSSDSNGGLAIAGLSAVGAVGAFALFAGDSEETQVEQSMDNVEPSKSGGEGLSLPDPKDEKSNEPLIDINKPISLPQIVNEEEHSNSASSLDKTVSKPINVIKSKDAWDSNEDDGGEAWLGSLSEIMNDGDETTTLDSSSFQ